VPFSAILFTMAKSIIALFKGGRLFTRECFAVSPNSSGWSGLSPLSKALSIALIAVILVAIGAIVYLVAVPHVGDRFTEFYILGPDGKAEDYPREVKVGQEARVILGMVNHEYENTSYDIEITTDGLRNKEIGPIVLAHQGKWEEKVSFMPTRVGENQKVEFLLYKNGQVEPYLSLRLWIDVKQ
jgi:uncharacterized membrane protein